MVLEHKLDNTAKDDLLNLVNCFLSKGIKVAESILKLENLLGIKSTK